EYEWWLASAPIQIRPPRTSTAAATRSKSDQFLMRAWPSVDVTAMTMPAINATSASTASCERTNGAMNVTIAAATIAPRGRLTYAGTMSHRVSVDQKYASGSGIRSAVYASAGIAAVATPTISAGMRDTTTRASA